MPIFNRMFDELHNVIFVDKPAVFFNWAHAGRVLSHKPPVFICMPIAVTGILKSSGKVWRATLIINAEIVYAILLKACDCLLY